MAITTTGRGKGGGLGRTPPGQGGKGTTPATADAADSGYSADPWGTVEKYVLKDASDPSTFGLPLTSADEYAKLGASYDKMRSDLGLSIDQLEQANESLLKGEIPADVAAQVRQIASESSVAGGLFGQGARALTARDLGTTSLQIKQQGIANKANIAGLQENAARLDESIRQFNKQYDLNVNQFMDTVRNTNLRGISLEESRLQFNAQQNLAITGLIMDMVKSQQEIGYSYSAQGLDASGAMSAFNDAIGQLSGLLGSSRVSA